MLINVNMKYSSINKTSITYPKKKKKRFMKYSSINKTSITYPKINKRLSHMRIFPHATLQAKKRDLQ